MVFSMPMVSVAGSSTACEFVTGGPLGETGCRYDLEPALDRLADHVRDSLDMDRIYQVLQL